jgi:hypothetical protein
MKMLYRPIRPDRKAVILCLSDNEIAANFLHKGEIGGRLVILAKPH